MYMYMYVYVYTCVDMFVYMYMYMYTKQLQLQMWIEEQTQTSLMTSAGPCEVAYGVQDHDGSYCALLCLTNAAIFYWESESDLDKVR